MSNPEARLALARLIADRIVELGIDRMEFMKLAGFTTASSFGSYLAGCSKLHLWQVPLVSKALDLDERQILLMCPRRTTTNGAWTCFGATYAREQAAAEPV